MKRFIIAGTLLASLLGHPADAVQSPNREQDTALLTGLACEAGRAYAHATWKPCSGSPPTTIPRPTYAVGSSIGRSGSSS